MRRFDASPRRSRRSWSRGRAYTSPRRLEPICVAASPVEPPSRSLAAPDRAASAGRVHVALGDNVSFGGCVRSALHLDGMVLAPTMTVDERTLVSGGVLALDVEDGLGM